MAKRIIILAACLALGACSSQMLAPPPMPGVPAIQAQTQLTAAIADPQSFYLSGITLAEIGCGGYFDAATLNQLQAAQTQGNANILAGIASAAMGLGNVPTPYTAGIGVAGTAVNAFFQNQANNSLAGSNPAPLGTLVDAAMNKVIDATPTPTSGAEAYRAVYAAYRVCSAQGIEALEQQAINSAVNNLVVVGGSNPPAAAMRSFAPGAATGSHRGLPIVRVGP